MKSKKLSVLAGASLIVLFSCGGCDTSAQTGTLAGAGIGALAGQAIGGNTAGTLIGAGVGALGGYMIGNEKDKKDQKDHYFERE